MGTVRVPVFPSRQPCLFLRGHPPSRHKIFFYALRNDSLMYSLSFFKKASMHLDEYVTSFLIFHIKFCHPIPGKSYFDYALVRLISVARKINPTGA